MEIVQDKWKEILQRVRDEHELSEISFTTWIEPLTIHSVEDNLITILVIQQNGSRLREQKIYYLKKLFITTSSPELLV